VSELGNAVTNVVVAAERSKRVDERLLTETGQGFSARLRQMLSLILGSPALVVGLSITLLFALMSFLAPWIAPHDPIAQNPAYRLALPGTSGYWLGGDGLGRDVLSRLLFAGRISLRIALASMVITLVIGVLVGAFAGFFGGWIDRVLMRFTDLVDTFPTFFLLILIAATFGGSVGILVVMIGVTSWPTNARVVRALMISLRDRDYVVASRVAGARDSGIVLRHLLPQLIPVMIASATIRVSGNIMTETGLSFLGLGIMPPTPSWGNMVDDGRDFLIQQWWQVAIPGVTIFIVVLGFNLLGEGLRDQLDPQSRRKR